MHFYLKRKNEIQFSHILLFKTKNSHLNIWELYEKNETTVLVMWVS
jgi:hypothetical protein